MAVKPLPSHTFTHVHIYTRDHVWLGAVGDELAEQNIDHALMLRFLDGHWGHKSLPTAICGTWVIGHPQPNVINLGIDGEASVFTLPGTATEKVDSSEEGPSDLLNLRILSQIDDRLYAAGMARRVYCRDAPGTWTAIDHGTFVSRDERNTAVGFNAIGGQSSNEIYAAGYKGEIWFYDGSLWEEQSSPTNVALTALTVADDSTVYICGLAGVLIVGRRGGWQIVNNEVTEDDFWGITTFGAKVYVAAYDGLYRIEGESLVPINMGLDRSVSTAFLDSRDGVMWSVGHKDIVVTENGVDWQILEGP